MATGIADLVQAQKAFSAARLKIMQAAQKGANPKVAVQQQQQALLKYLQTRAQLLTDARERALQQFETQIANYQQKIGELQQIMKETPVAAPEAAPVEDVAAVVAPAKKKIKKGRNPLK